jgi:hypothetical protein
MEERLQRFYKGELNAEELASFRDEINNMNDVELDEMFNNISAERTEFEICSDSLKESLQHDIKEPLWRKRTFLLTSVAAALIILFSSISIFFFLKSESYSKYDNLISNEITISTGKGEKFITVLPDGSKVTLGPLSSLSYELESFNDEERVVKWKGEGYFDIKKIKNNSFSLIADFFKISVLGTSFSISTLTDDDSVEVYLKEGSIQLTPINNNPVVLSPGETAVIKRSTGSINLISKDSAHHPGFIDNLIYFHSTSLKSVVNKLNDYYDVEIELNPKYQSLKYTGALPTDNLNMALSILEMSFNITTITHRNHIEIR